MTTRAEPVDTHESRRIRNKAACSLREMADRLDTDEYASEAAVTIEFFYEEATEEATESNCYPDLSHSIPTGYLITIKAMFPRKATNAQ